MVIQHVKDGEWFLDSKTEIWEKGWTSTIELGHSEENDWSITRRMVIGSTRPWFVDSGNMALWLRMFLREQ